MRWAPMVTCLVTVILSTSPMPLHVNAEGSSSLGDLWATMRDLVLPTYRDQPAATSRSHLAIAESTKSTTRKDPDNLIELAGSTVPTAAATAAGRADTKNGSIAADGKPSAPVNNGKATLQGQGNRTHLQPSAISNSTKEEKSPITASSPEGGQRNVSVHINQTVIKEMPSAPSLNASVSTEITLLQSASNVSALIDNHPRVFFLIFHPSSPPALPTNPLQELRHLLM